jgi:hypothetical protein
MEEVLGSMQGELTGPGGTGQFWAGWGLWAMGGTVLMYR